MITTRECNTDNDKSLNIYTSWGGEKQEIFAELLTKLYEELKTSPTGNEPKIKKLSDKIKEKAQQELIKTMNKVSLNVLKKDVPEIKKSGVQNWIKAQNERIKSISQKTLTSTRRVTRSSKSRKPKKTEYRLKERINPPVKIEEKEIIKNYPAPKPQQSHPQKKLKEPSATTEKLTKMPIEDSPDALWKEFSGITDSALTVSENMTENEVNPFAAQLKQCKEILKEQESHILLAQKVKETILLCAAVYNRISIEVPKGVYGRVRDPNKFMKQFEFVLSQRICKNVSSDSESTRTAGKLYQRKRKYLEQND